MTSKALVIKTSSGPPQPLLAWLMSVRGRGRPQSPASRHIAACLLLVCYFHWFLNAAGRLFKAKMKSMGFKGQKCQWPHPPAWPRHERIHLSCRSDLQLPLRSCDGRTVTYHPHWRYTAHPISAGESRSQNSQTNCEKKKKITLEFQLLQNTLLSISHQPLTYFPRNISACCCVIIFNYHFLLWSSGSPAVSTCLQDMFRNMSVRNAEQI